MRALLLIPVLAMLACGNGEDPPARGPASVPVEVPPGLNGRVKDETGAAVAGAEVRIHIPRLAGYRGWKEGLTTETDAAGAFHFDVDGELRPMAVTKILLFVNGEEIVPFIETIPAYRPGGSVSVQVPVKRAGTASGRVLSETGEPVAGALVYAIPESEVGAESEDGAPSARSAPDGTYRIAQLQPGPWVIGARGDTTAPTVVGPVEVRPLEDVKVPEIRLSDGGSIRGTVVTEAGDPVPDCRVSAYRVAELSTIMLYGIRNFANAGGTAFTGPDGSFTIPGLPDAEYAVSALSLGHRLGGEPPTGIRVGTEDLRITVEAGEEVHIRVLDPRTKQEIPRFEISVRWVETVKESRVLSITGESEDGVFRFRALPDRIYRIEVSAPGYEVGGRDLRMPGPGPHKFKFGLLPR